MTNIKKGLLQGIERTILTGVYTLTIPDDTTEIVESIEHNIGKPPFVDYKLSYDNGITWTPRYAVGFFGEYRSMYIMLYTDDTNLYIHYIAENNPATTVLINYQVFVVEGI